MLNGFEVLGQSMRHSARALRRDVLFTMPVVLCIALAVGANSAVFSVVDALMLSAVPFEEPDRLVVVNALHASPDMEAQEAEVSPKDFLALREQSRSFSALASVYPRNFNLAVEPAGGAGGDLEPERVEGARISHELFSLLRVQPALGRGFTAEEEQPGGEPVAILGDGLWRRWFGADPGVLGKTLLVDGKSTRVVGVMAPGFRYPEDSEIWTPQVFETASPTHEWHYMDPVGRLAPGVAVETAGSEVAGIARRLEQELPETNSGWSAAVEPLQDAVVGDLRPKLLALWVGVGFLLLIACANIANLLLVRAMARSKEMAVRVAMGSSQVRLASLVLSEGALLALAGGASGLLLGGLAIRLIAGAPLDLPALRELSLNLRVVGFTVLVTFVSGLLFSLTPAVRLLRLDPQSFLKEGTRGSTQGSRAQGVFVVLQVGMSVVLLTTALLLLRSFGALQSVDPGFEPQGLLTMRVSLPESKYPGSLERAQFAEQTLARLGSLPAVRSASLTTALPVVDRDVDLSAGFSVEGRVPANQGSEYQATIRYVSPDFFSTMGIPLLEGRPFSREDRAGAPGVVVVSRAMARQYWPGASPVGKRIKLGEYTAPNPWLTVVGVAGDVRDEGLQSEPEPMWYRPYAQHEDKSARYVALLLRTEGSPGALARPARQEIRAIDSLLPAYQISTLEELLAESLAQQRVVGTVFGALSVLGLVIASIGLYGLMSYVVNQRRREFGIRMAVGAGSRDVLRLVMRRGMLMAVGGLVLGVCAMLLLAGPLSSLLYGVRATDPLSHAAIVLLLGIVAMLASLIPARRATRVDPMIAFRAE